MVDNGGDVTPAEVDAALAVLREHFDLGGSAAVANFVWEGQTPRERADGIRRLQVADEMAEQKVRIAVADAIRAVRKASHFGR